MKLAELIIDLKANTAQLARDFEQAHDQATKFVSKISSVLSNIGVGLSLGGLAAGFKELVDYEDQLGHMAKSAGMSAEQMSGLAFAVKSFDLPLSSVTEGLTKFDKIIEGLSRSKMGAKAVQELGLSLADLAKASPHEALLKVADAFQKHADGAQKAAIASALFGGAGQAMIPFLDQGAAGIERMEAKAKALGLTLSEEDVQGAEDAKRAYAGLEGTLRGVEMTIGNTLMPGFNVLAGLLTGDYNLWMAVGDAIGEAIDWFDKWAIKITTFGIASTKPLDDDMKRLAADMSEHLTAFYTAQGVGSPEPKKISFEPPAAAPGGKDHASRLNESLKALRDFNIAEREYQTILRALEPPLTGVSKAQLDYFEILQKLVPLQQKGVDTTVAGALAWKQHQAAIQEALKPPGAGAMPTAGGWQSALGAPQIPGAPIPGMFDKMDVEAKKLGADMSASFAQMIVYGKGFGSMLQGLLEQMVEFVLQATIFKGIASALEGTGGFGGLIGSFFGGMAGHAAGGNVTAGVPSIVGESGPELFIPGASGAIIPNSGLGGVVVNYNVDARGADAFADKRLLLAMKMTKDSAVNQSINAAREARLRSAG